MKCLLTKYTLCLLSGGSFAMENSGIVKDFVKENWGVFETLCMSLLYMEK